MLNFYNNLDNLPLLLIILIWSLVWKGLALWRAAKLGQKPWFVIMLAVNTIGLLEIIYLAVTQKRYKQSADAPGSASSQGVMTDQAKPGQTPENHN